MDFPILEDYKAIATSINNDSDVVTVKRADKCTFDAYASFYKEEGFEVFESRSREESLYIALKRGDEGVFLNYYAGIAMLTAVYEKNTSYFDFSAPSGAAIVAPQISQIHLEDFGMSYVIRLSDGRYIIIDGGREFEPDAKRLYDCLKEGSPKEKPVIAAWIFTHPHSDHFHCFVKFFDMYSDEVIIERFMYTFPEHDDVEHYPAMTSTDYRFDYNTSADVFIPIMQERIAASGAKVYSPHTGQRYVIGDASCDILASIDDTILNTKNVNATSLVIRMELGGQVILWGADATFSEIKLPEKYGKLLKSDILQIPHHGFQSGTSEAEIAGYKVINPKVCFLPVSDFNAYTIFCTYRDATRFLMRDAGVDEIITGDETRTITLPYTAPYAARCELRRKYLSGLNASGATSWIFTDLNTANEDDFVFTILNTANKDATVWVELFFADNARDLRHIKAVIPKLTIKKLSVVGDEVEDDALFFNWMNIKTRGIPENEDFAIRFTCDTPIVVSNQAHRATYHSNHNE